MKIKLGLGVFLVFFLAGALQAQSINNLLKSVEKNPAWSSAGDAKRYDEKSINGFDRKAAPTLKRYGLTGVAVQDWKSADGPVRLTLYEMTDPSAAYGFFTLQRDGSDASLQSVPLGTEGFRNGARTFFWQAEYVVKLEGDPKAADGLGHLFSENILGKSSKPPVSGLLPPNNMVQGTEKYILDGADLAPSLKLDPKILGFDDDLEVAVAQYKVDGKAANLVLLLYPTQQLAKKYLEQWDVTFPAEKDNRKRVGPLIAWVRGAPDAQVSQSILGSVGYESKVTWDLPRPDISLRTVILTIFSFIGVALLFIFVVGLSFGGLRVFVKWRFPDRVFDRSVDNEIIQLKLDQELTNKELRP